MKHIGQIGILKKIPRLTQWQATEVWKITITLLPSDCAWRDKETLGIEALEMVSYFYMRKETTTLDSICSLCAQAYNKISCSHRIKYLH